MYYQMIIEDRIQRESMKLEHPDKEYLVDFFLHWYLGRVVLLDNIDPEVFHVDAASWIDTMQKCNMREDLLNFESHDGKFTYDLVAPWDGNCLVTMEEIK